MATTEKMTTEKIVSGKRQPLAEFLPDVEIRMFASAETGASAMSTGTATFLPSGYLPYHTHGFSEAVTVIQGKALFKVEGRVYLLQPLDCIHVPAGVPHKPANASNSERVVMLSAFASPVPTRELVVDSFKKEDRGSSDPKPGDPEHIARFAKREIYDLADGTEFSDLFAGRFGSVGICGGYGRFQPGSSLPCHIHDYDESITIVEGEAICQVAGQQYNVSDCDTAFVPQGKPHRFLNESDKPMAMVWVYAGSEPSRAIVDVQYCEGKLPWQDLHRNRKE